jgi:hypothetical protein
MNKVWLPEEDVRWKQVWKQLRRKYMTGKWTDNSKRSKEVAIFNLWCRYHKLEEESTHRQFTASHKIYFYWDWFIKTPLGWDGQLAGTTNRQP